MLEKIIRITEAGAGISDARRSDHHQTEKYQAENRE
jgi:hypothetical protein